MATLILPFVGSLVGYITCKGIFQFHKGPGDFLGFALDLSLGPIIGFMIGGLLGMLIDIIIAIYGIFKSDNGLGIVSSTKIKLAQIMNNQNGLIKNMIIIILFGIKIMSTIIGIIIISSLITKMYVFSADSIIYTLNKLIFDDELTIICLSVIFYGVLPIYGIVILLPQVKYDKSMIAEILVCFFCSRIFVLDYLVAIVMRL